MIRLEGITDDQIACSRLYQKKPNAAFSQLKKRLRDDLLDLMLMFSNPDNALNGYFEAEMVASKQILQGKILIRRGLTESGMTLIKKAFKLAGEYEAFEVQTLAYEALKNYSENVTNVNEFQDLELQFSRNVDILYDIINLRLECTPESSQTGESAPSGIFQEVKPVKDTAQSARLHFQYTIKLMEEYLQAQKYRMARVVAEEILPLVDHENQVLTRHQKADYFFLFAKILALLGFYKESVFYAKKASGYYGFNYDKCIRTFLLTYRGMFYNNDVEEAAGYLRQFEECYGAATDGQQRNELELLKAWQDFYRKDYVASIKGLNHCFKLSAGNSEISLNGKLLEMLNLLMMKDDGWFDYKLDSFRKYVSNASQKKFISRFSLLYKIFSLIRQLRKKENPDIRLKFHNSMLLLQQSNKPYSWNPLGYELIPVDRIIHKMVDA